MEKEIKVFLLERTNKLQELQTMISNAYWEFSTQGSESVQNKLAKAKKDLANFLSNHEDFKKIKDFMESDIQDNLLTRQISDLYNTYLPYQTDPKLIQEMIKLETAIESEFTNFRAEMEGQRLSNNEINDILQNSLDSSKRKAVYLASKQIGKRVAPILIELVKLRNQAAQKMGYENFYSLSLETSDLNQVELFDILDHLKELTDEPFKKIKKKIDLDLSKKLDVQPEQLMPWHYSDPFFQDTPVSNEIDLNIFFKDQDIVELVKKYYRGIGLDVEDILSRSDLYEREGKNQHAFCMHVDGEGDVRTLCNLKNTEQWMNTLLHELGHGVYDKYLDFDLPYILRRPAHMFLTEAIATMFGSLAHNPQWLIEVCGVDADKIDEIKKQLLEEEQRVLLIFLRWGLVMVYFERELYQNPDQDLNTLWWNLVEEMQLLTRPEGRNEHPDWAAKIHLSNFPVYYHNYILGYLAAYQIEATLKNELQITDLVNNPEIGLLLKEKIFQPGAKYRWNELLLKATGHPLTADFAAKILN